MNRIAEALRGLIAAQNDKAYRTPEDQDRLTEARAALEEWDGRDAAPRAGSSVATERAMFIEAMTWGSP